MPKKDGLNSALDFTKFVITLDGALIAFVTGATFLQDIQNWWEILATILALAALLTSIVAGILVSMAVATMLSDGNYDLAHKPLSIPGMFNVIGFGLGSAAIAALATFELLIESPVVSPARQTFEIGCKVGDSMARGLNCSGSLSSDAK